MNMTNTHKQPQLFSSSLPTIRYDCGDMVYLYKDPYIVWKVDAIHITKEEKDVPWQVKYWLLHEYKEGSSQGYMASPSEMFSSLESLISHLRELANDQTERLIALSSEALK